MVVIRRKIGIWPCKWREIALLPEEFASEPEKILDVSIQGDMDMVMELSTRIHEFCTKHTSQTEKIRYLSLAIEEMAGNIVQYGRKGNKPLTIDMRIMILEDGIAFRLRDDGISFNPVQYDDEHREEFCKTLGIRMIRGIAREMRYTHAIGMNNLFILI